MYRAIGKTMRNHKYKSNVGEAGFTLVEIAMVLLISGMFIAAGAQFLKSYTQNAKYEKTIDHVKEIQETLYEYYIREGGYPCPADPSLRPNEAGYGESACRSVANFNANRADCTGVPAGIACPDPATSGARDVDGDGVSDIVLIGALPFRTLAEYLDNIDGNIQTTTFREVHKKDGFGHLFTYAVTESMTTVNPENSVLTPARPYDGAIAVEDENGLSLTDPYGAAHYVIFSHGDNGRGGYTDRGAMVADCIIMDLTDPMNPVPMPSPIPSPAPGLGGGLDLELENCNFENAIFLKGIRSTADNSDYYDDMLFFKVSESAPVWQISLRSEDNESRIYNTNEGSAGIGLVNAPPSEKLHVIGNVLGEGDVLAEEYCDGVSNTCLDPNDLGGTGSTCPSGQAAYGISEGKLLCTDVDWQPLLTDCPIDSDGNQTYLHAISNLGRITCCLEDGTDCQNLP